MKTLYAILAHAGVGAIQALSGAQFFNGNNAGSALGNTYTQIGLQTGLMFLQGYLANKNSKTDPNGNKLVQSTVTGDFQTTANK